MKVITIKQPWATLIAEGLKEYEFRTWNTKYRGEILIHAGLAIDKEALERFKDYNLEYPKGCIIAKAKITDSIKVDNNFINSIGPKDSLVYKSIIENKSGNDYAFKLEQIEKINPIFVKGQLGLWNYEIKEELKKENL